MVASGSVEGVLVDDDRVVHCRMRFCIVFFDREMLNKSKRNQRNAFTV